MDYTPILKLALPPFDDIPWDDPVNGNFSVLDAAFGKYFNVPGLTGVWKNSTVYSGGQSAIDDTDSSIWTCTISHTSPAAPTTFAQDRAAFPTRWGGVPSTVHPLPISGGTMTGALILSGDPTAARGAATKQYVDSKIGGPGYLPLTGGTLTGDLTISDTLYLSAGGMSLSISTNFSIITFDDQGYDFLYTRATGLLQYRRGNDGVELWSVDALGNCKITSLLTVAAKALIGGFGITYTGIGTHVHGFDWTGSQLIAYVDGVRVGAVTLTP